MLSDTEFGRLWVDIKEAVAENTERRKTIDDIVRDALKRLASIIKVAPHGTRCICILAWDDDPEAHAALMDEAAEQIESFLSSKKLPVFVEEDGTEALFEGDDDKPSDNYLLVDVSALLS